jgi:UrcA family protein
LVSGSASAASLNDLDSGLLSVPVSSEGLDLSRVGDAGIMLARLRAAASEACGEQPRPMELDRTADYRACVRAALDSAVDRLGAPRVAELYHAGETRMVAGAGAAR